MEWCRIGAKVPSFEASQDAIPCRWMGSFPSCIACSWVGSFLGCNACSCAEASQDVTPAAGPTARNHPEATHPSFRHGSPWSWRQLPRGIACKRCIFTWTSLLVFWICPQVSRGAQDLPKGIQDAPGGVQDTSGGVKCVLVCPGLVVVCCCF